MNDKDKIRKLIREALFQNIDFGGGAPADVDEAPPTEAPEKQGVSQGKSVPIFIDLNKSKKANSNAYINVIKIGNQYAKNKRLSPESFKKMFDNMNNSYNNIIHSIRKEYKNNKKLTDRNIDSLNKSSQSFIDFFKKSAPNALKDKSVMTWYKPI